MKAFRIIVPALLLATTVFAQDTTYNFDKEANFSKFKTYRWEKHPQSKDLDQITMTKLGAAFDAELAKKGLTKTDSKTPDLVIVYQLAVKQEKEINSYSSGFATGPGWGGGYGGYGGGSSTTNTSVSTISVGSLNLDMYELSSKHLVWRGIATKTLDDNVKPDKQEKNMAKAAEKMLKNYPPPPAKK